MRNRSKQRPRSKLTLGSLSADGQAIAKHELLALKGALAALLETIEKSLTQKEITHERTE